jgi:hypothetical protein
MIYFLCENASGELFQITRGVKEAKLLVFHAGGGTVTKLNVPINGTTIKKLLLQQGGYANSSEVVFTHIGVTE